jgi:penicillin-binding protein 2
MVSCNYYFYEAVYRLGNTASGTMLEGIRKLNEYMIYFGLGSPTGVEIFDTYSGLLARAPEGVFPIASPDYRQFVSSGRWTDGATLHTAIGQGDNTVTSSVMAKYTATLASGGIRYQMHFQDRVETFDGQLVSQFTPVIEEVVPMSESTLNVIQKGMLAATSNSRGTAFRVFRDFPIQVAGKTGTAQEDGWPNHSSFAAYAPYDNPTIALFVLMPGSIQNSIPAPAAVVARDALEAYFRLNTEPQKPIGENTLIRN